MAIGFKVNKGQRLAQTWLAGEDVSVAIRTESCAAFASQLAACDSVRLALLDRQRAFRQWPGLVTDGRDMGTVVFPQADLKVFLTASAEKRAWRRYQQLKAIDSSVSLARLLAEIRARDKRDKERTVSPLRPAKHALIIDSSELTIAQVEDRMWQEIIRHKLNKCY
jgi:cytidylate kinase